MTDPVLIKVAYVIAAVIAYGLLRRRLMVVAHEFRIQAGCEADRWAANSQVNPKIRESLVFLADMAYRPTMPWRVLLGIIVAMFLPLRRSTTASGFQTTTKSQGRSPG